MHQGKFVFSQVVSIISQYEFNKSVEKYKGNYRAKDLRCWQHFLYMMFGQLTYREGIRDIISCLDAHKSKVYHLGLKKIVAHTSLTRANENRDWRIWADFAQSLIKTARPLYLEDSDFTLELDNTVYALDSSTIDLCLSVFKWAKFRKKKAAVKLHTMIDLRGNIPVFIEITDGKVHDVNILDQIDFEPGAFYIIDKGYYDFERLYKINQAKAFFVIRAKKNLKFKRMYSSPIDKSTGLRCDQTIKLTGTKSSVAYPEKLRRIKFYDEGKPKTYKFLTNNFEVDALDITKLYKNRWHIELFFKWVKQHLKIKKFWGQSENAVKTQIWIAVCTYLIIAILKKKLNLDKSLYEILQILSVSVFDKTPVNQLLTSSKLQILKKGNHNQLILFDL
ncbi:MAG: IS4 family transposase [Candidatus Marinimicrobia bacterium]|jgi:transposase|nr:IS4 family transposase [Candidatus Neomarinimicrobiota bacterium]